MSRFCGEIDAAPILSAAEAWVSRALKSDGSVFSEQTLWSLPHLLEIEKYYIEGVAEGEGSFLEKLQRQLNPASREAKMLASEMIWVMLLCPDNISSKKKKEDIRLVWSWSGATLPEDTPFLSQKTLSGIGSGGQSFNYMRWRELVFLTRVALELKRLSAGERDRLLGDGWALSNWLSTIPEADSRQLRHMLLFLIFPDQFERVFGGNDRRAILARLTMSSAKEVNALSQTQKDRELFRVRQELEAQYKTSEIDFYVAPVLSRWKVSAGPTDAADISYDCVIQALREIDQADIPPDAKSTTYDLIHGERRYPPKLVYSLAHKYSSGSELDRNSFTGGEKSPAFAALRKLGFHIERKDFIGELVNKFVAQAEAAEDLKTAQYPKLYRGLSVAVGFGKGNFAKVPWISFLGFGQTTQEGSYPVFLYYREAEVLILAYGVSETSEAQQEWRNLGDTQTVEEFLEKNFGKSPERYGDSFVFSSYRVPDDLENEALSRDLDKLISQYQSQFGPAAAAARTDHDTSPKDADVASPPSDVAEPYTHEQALEELFVDGKEFAEILGMWERKQNLILQGPPGVGKSFFFRRLAYALLRERDPTRLEAVQFHQSYSYEDFVQGYRPGAGGFERRDGLFIQFCSRAKDDADRKYVFVIDEINRGNLSKIFGELMLLVEHDKRGKDWTIPLAYSKNTEERFYIPKNVYLLGLMNTADRSLSMVDYAMRRRFAFATLKPAFSNPRFKKHLAAEGTPDQLIEKIVRGMSRLNQTIADDTTNLGPGFCIGHSFFCNFPRGKSPSQEWFEEVVLSEIAPLIREYWFDDSVKAESLVSQLLSA